MKKNSILIKVFASTDDTEIAWRFPRIDNCRGFAILRQRKGENPELSEWVKSSVGFKDSKHETFEYHDTTIWPIQKYNWTDFLVNNGETVRYKVIPMIQENNTLVKHKTMATEWSSWIEVNSKKTNAFFNRGMVSSQFVAKRLTSLPEKEKKKSLDAHLNDPSSPLRALMGGDLLEAVYSILDESAKAENKDVHLFAVLYELNDLVLIKKLNTLGKRAHVILANGAFGKEKKDPQQQNAKLLTRVDLTRRIVKSPHFAHNKFAVLARKSGRDFIPYKVLTGSTNWTHNGLFTQVNNAIILDDKSATAYYLEEWNKIKADCNAKGQGLYAKPFKDFNKTPKETANKKIRTWFTPTAETADMKEAESLIASAREGILFLMFKPGNIASAVLYSAIQQRLKGPNAPFVQGVINADPGGKKAPTIYFVNKGKEQKGSLSVVTPKNIKEEFTFWSKEPAPPSVTIHSKIVLIDPFGENPILLTGSHNMGNKASKSNDDNLNIIRGNSKLAESYAVHIMSVYHHYRWRYFRASQDLKSSKISSPKWDGLVNTDDWQDWYTSGNNKKELDFWI